MTNEEIKKELSIILDDKERLFRYFSRRRNMTPSEKAMTLASIERQKEALTQAMEMLK